MYWKNNNNNKKNHKNSKSNSLTFDETGVREVLPKLFIDFMQLYNPTLKQYSVMCTV